MSSENSETKYRKQITKYEREGFYKILFSRRDVRSHFIRKDIPLKTILRIINAAHHAPSVGYSQPWNFILVKDEKTRKKIKDSFLNENERATKLLEYDNIKQNKYYKNKNRRGELDWSGFLKRKRFSLSKFRRGLDDSFFLFERRHNT